MTRHDALQEGRAKTATGGGGHHFFVLGIFLIRFARSSHVPKTWGTQRKTMHMHAIYASDQRPSYLGKMPAAHAERRLVSDFFFY